MGTDGLLAPEVSDVSKTVPRDTGSGGHGPDRPADAPPVTGRAPRGFWRRSPSRAAGAVLLIGLVVTAALALTCLRLYEANEKRLLDLRVRQLGLVLTAAVPSIQTPLASAAELADATSGSVQKFRAIMAPYVGPGRQYASASLWPLGTRTPRPSVVLGSAPELASRPAQARVFFAHAPRTPQMSVIGILNSAAPTVGYEFNSPISRRGFAAYAESPLQKDRRSKKESDSAFSDLNYVVYLGRSRGQSNLLVTNLQHLPVSGRQASDVVPFGDTVLTLVVTPNGSLGGNFFQSLPWIIAVGGVLISIAAALVTDRLARGRIRAERLAIALDHVASENRAMYSEQRTIAQTLQHALLPDSLPRIEGLDVGARYVPAASGIDVGGDWYDVVARGGGKTLLVIGDVSGHGLPAATTMAAIRHATLAYAASDAGPAAILSRLSDYVNGAPHEHFATVLCILVDVNAHRLTAASAGHLPPLLVDGGDARFLDLHPNPPIGVPHVGEFEEIDVEVHGGATLLAVTDGLVERRGEVIDVGLARLRSAAIEVDLALEDLLTRLASQLAPVRHHDDTAIMGVRWRT